jgi:hypothetical protein
MAMKIPNRRDGDRRRKSQIPKIFCAVACIILSASTRAAEPSIRNQAAYTTFAVAEPKVVLDGWNADYSAWLTSITAEKPAYAQGERAAFTVAITNRIAAAYDVTVDVNVQNGFWQVHYDVKDQVVHLEPSKASLLRQEFTIPLDPNHPGEGGYYVTVTVKYQGKVIAERKNGANYPFGADFKIIARPPLQILPDSPVVYVGESIKLTTRNADGSVTFTNRSTQEWGGSADYYGAITADGTFRPGTIGGIDAYIKVQDASGFRAYKVVRILPVVRIAPEGEIYVLAGTGRSFNYTGQGFGSTPNVTYQLTVNSSGGSLSGSYYTAGSRTGVTDVVTMTDNSSGKKSTCRINVYGAATVSPKDVHLACGQSAQFYVSGGRPGTTYTFEMNKGAEYLGTITSNGSFTATHRPSSGVTLTTTNAIVVRSNPTAPYLYTNVAIEEKWPPPPPPGPVSISPTSVTLGPYGRTKFTVGGGQGQITITIEGGPGEYYVYGAYKLIGNELHLMASNEPMTYKIKLRDSSGSTATATVTIKDQPPSTGRQIYDASAEVVGLFSDEAGTLMELGGKGYDIGYDQKQYSDFGGQMFQGAYRKGATVIAINLNDSRIVRARVLDDSGTYRIRVPWIGPTRIEASGPFWDEFVGEEEELPENLAAVTVGVPERLVECSLNFPTTVAAELVEDELNRGAENGPALVTHTQVTAANVRVGDAIGLSDGTDISKVRIGDDDDTNSRILTAFHLAMAAAAGPQRLGDAARQLAAELTRNAPLGSSRDGVVSAYELEQLRDAIFFGDDIVAMTSDGRETTVPLAVVMARLRGDTGLASVVTGTVSPGILATGVPRATGHIEWTTGEGPQSAILTEGSHEAVYEFPGAEAGTVTKIEVPPGYEAVVEYAE